MGVSTEGGLTLLWGPSRLTLRFPVFVSPYLMKQDLPDISFLFMVEVVG